jgi:hypothetical protein
MPFWLFLHLRTLSEYYFMSSMLSYAVRGTDPLSFLTGCVRTNKTNSYTVHLQAHMIYLGSYTDTQDHD